MLLGQKCLKSVRIKLIYRGGNAPSSSTSMIKMKQQQQQQPLSKNQKRRLRKKQLVIQQNPPRQRQQTVNQPTVVGKALREVGQTVGGFIGLPSFGQAVGAGISRIFGQGDYQINKVNSNTLQSGAPAFSSLTSGFRITHREYIRDISSSSVFSSTTFNINPGVNTTFPWLSQVAANFEQYKIRGMVVYLNSSSGSAVGSTNTALGIWGVVTQYDPTEASFTNKQQAENYVGCQSAVPSQSLIHGIECKPSSTVIDKMYIRTGSIPDSEDLKFYDWGKFQVFTSGSQAVSVIGELWVSYDIEFYKPRLPSGGMIAYSDWFYSTAGTQTAPMGNPAPNPLLGSNLGTTIMNTFVANQGTIVFPSSAPIGLYMISICGSGGSTVVPTMQSTVSGSVAFYALLDGRTKARRWSTNTTGYTYELVVWKSTLELGYVNVWYDGTTGVDKPTVGTSVVFLGGSQIATEKQIQKFSLDEVTMLRKLLKLYQEKITEDEASKGGPDPLDKEEIDFTKAPLGEESHEVI